MIPRLATEAVATGSDHAGAEFVEDLERRLVAVQAKLALELDGRDAWRMARNEVGGPEPDRQRRAGPLHDRRPSAHYPADICGTAEPAAGWRSGRVRWLRRTIRRRTRRASGWLQGKQRKPYRQETGVGTRAVNPERADPRWARQRRAWRHLVSAAKLPMVYLGVNRISMVWTIPLIISAEISGWA